MDSSEHTEGALIARVPGSSIASPHANHGATYLSSRGLWSLIELGALQGVPRLLAARVDGIVANEPADRRFGIDELLTIEKPGYIDTLFPEERAALPVLWSLLETENTQPAAVSFAPSPVHAVDVSRAPAFAGPGELEIRSLPELVWPLMDRLQLTQNADSNPLTVSKAELVAALATPGAFTSREVEYLRWVQREFRKRGACWFHAVVEVSEPYTRSTGLVAFGDARIDLTETLQYTEIRRHARPIDGLNVRIDAIRERSATVTMPDTQLFLEIDETSHAERIVRPGRYDVRPGKFTFEAWSGGARLGTVRATFPEGVALQREVTDLSDYADYVFSTGTRFLFRNAISAKQTQLDDTTFEDEAVFAYELVQRPPPYGDFAATATPRFPVRSCRYAVPTSRQGSLVVDVSTSGAVRMDFGRGWKRAKLLLSPFEEWHFDNHHWVIDRNGKMTQNGRFEGILDVSNMAPAIESTY